MAVQQSTVMLIVPAPSPAGWLPQGICDEHKICAWQTFIVGAGLLAIAVQQSTVMLIVPAPSPAGWLPQGICDEHKICAWQTFIVGAGLLAIAVQQSTVMLIVPAPSPAGSPTGDLRRTQDLCLANIHCRSRLAGDGGAAVNGDVECAGPIASRLAPTGDLR
nr:hypothetical protein [Pseudomonas fluorescens]